MNRSGNCFVVGLTGGIGAGKSTVASLFEEEGVRVISADVLAHRALDSKEVRDRLEEMFGGSIRRPDGSIDRPALAGIVFGDEEKRGKLNGLIHPEVRRQFHAIRDSLGSDEILIYDVPLLFEAGLESEFDLTVTVTASRDLRYERVRQRNGWSEEEFLSRESSQMPLEEKERRADQVIRNEGNLDELKTRVRDVLKRIRGGSGGIEH